MFNLDTCLDCDKKRAYITMMVLYMIDNKFLTTHKVGLVPCFNAKGSHSSSPSILQSIHAPEDSHTHSLLERVGEFFNQLFSLRDLQSILVDEITGVSNFCTAIAITFLAHGIPCISEAVEKVSLKQMIDTKKIDLSESGCLRRILTVIVSSDVPPLFLDGLKSSLSDDVLFSTIVEYQGSISLDATAYLYSLYLGFSSLPRQ